jgi:hypothetical protein
VAAGVPFALLLPFDEPAGEQRCAGVGRPAGELVESSRGDDRVRCSPRTSWSSFAVSMKRLAFLPRDRSASSAA